MKAVNIDTEQESVALAYGMATYVYFDIETIPCQAPEYLDELRRNVTAPGAFKKQDSIDAWLAENRETAAAEALAKTSFDGGRGHICTIAWAKNGGDASVLHADTLGEERSVIKGFFDALDEYHSEIFVGHNIAGFDLPFLRKRAVVLGLKLPDSLPRDPKPWDKSLHDTMVMWAGAKDRISLDALCGILGIPGKDGFDGSQVAEAWANGEHDKIAEYCCADIWRTRDVHQRFLAAGW